MRVEIRSGTDPDGLPLLFLHGFLGQPAMWNDVLEALGPTGPVGLAHLPGHGPDPKPLGTRTFIELVDDFAKTLTFSRPCLLVGYSMGARFGLLLALRHSAQFAGAILVSGDPGLKDEASRSERRAWDGEQAARLELDGLAKFTEYWEALPVFDSQSQALRARQRTMRRDHTVHGLAESMRSLGLGNMPNMRAYLADPPFPVHFVTGTLDEKFTGIASALVAGSTGDKLTHEAIEGAGHNVPLEAPKAFARVIDRAIKSQKKRT